MAKGFFTQGVTLLTNGQTTIEDIKATLTEAGYEIVKEVPPAENWAFGGPTVVVAFLPEVNGYASVDVVNQPWPDSMGNPKTDGVTFAGWSMGHFGPFAYPGGLVRAGQHSWAWAPGKTIADGHGGFIRLRISYVFGGGGNTPVMPADYDPLAEMLFLSEAAMALLKARGVICYFNSSGEVLRDDKSFCELWDACAAEEKIPLALWMNIRFFKLNPQLGFMDTVGNSQLDIRDVEAVFPLAVYDPGDIDYYLRNVSHYLLGLDREMKTGEDIDGPGESNLSWTMEVLDQGVVHPPRRVLRLYPKASAKAVRAAVSSIK